MLRHLSILILAALGLLLPAAAPAITPAAPGLSIVFLPPSEATPATDSADHPVDAQVAGAAAEGSRLPASTVGPDCGVGKCRRRKRCRRGACGQLVGIAIAIAIGFDPDPDTDPDPDWGAGGRGGEGERGKGEGEPEGGEEEDGKAPPHGREFSGWGGGVSGGS